MRAVLIALCLLVVSCSTFNLKSEKNNPNIAYINMRIVYSAIALKDKDITSTELLKKDLTKQLSNKMLSVKKRAELERKHTLLKRKLIILRKKVYNTIYVAIKAYAREENIDFILHIGEQVIFAKKKYDVTDKIIEKVLILQKRSAPKLR